MTETPVNPGEAEAGAAYYELQVYAQSPTAPSPKRLCAEAEGGGLARAILEQDGAGPDDAAWSRLVIGTGDSPHVTVVSVYDDLESQLALFREDADAGDEIPAELFETRRLYVIEYRVQPGEGEAQVEEDGSYGAYFLTAWALAGLTDGLIFDPEEDLFADADGFFEVLMDEELAQAGLGGPADD